MNEITTPAEAKRHILPWFYGWNVIGVALLFQAFTVGIVIYSFALLVPPWMEEFAVSRTEIMMANMIVVLGITLLSPFVGRALDSQSIRAIVTLGLLILAAGLAALSFANNFWLLVIGFGVVGALAMALASTLAAQTLAAKWFRANLGLAMGLMPVGGSIGGFAIPPIVAYLVHAFGWRPTFLILSLVILVVGLPLVWLIVGNSPEDKGVEPEPAKPSSEPDEAQEIFPDWTLKLILTNRNYWITAIAFGFPFFVLNGIAANFVLYAQDIGITPQSAAFLISILSIVTIIGKIFFGAMADRVDHRLLHYLGLACFALAVFLMIGTPSYGLMVLVASLIGFAGGGIIPMMGAVIGSRFGSAAFGRVMGIVYFALIFNAFSSPIAGAIRDRFGSYDVFFQGALVLMAISAIVIFWLPPLRRAPQN